MDRQYIDRMTERLRVVEMRVGKLDRRAEGEDEQRLADGLRAGLAVTRSRLHELRRSGLDPDADAVAALSRSFERVNAALAAGEQRLG